MKKKPMARKTLGRKPYGEKPAPKAAGRAPAAKSGGWSDEKPAGRPFGRARAGGDFEEKRPYARKGADDKPYGRRFNGGDEKPAGRRFNSGDEKPAGRRFNTGDEKRAGRRFNNGDEKPAGRRFNGGDEKPAGRRFSGGDEKPAARRFKGGDDAPAGRRFKGADDKPAGRPFGRARAGGDFEEKRSYGRKGADEKPAGRRFKGDDDKPAGRRFKGADFASEGRGFKGGPAKARRDFAEPLRRGAGDDEPRTRGKAAGRKLELNFDDLIYGIHAVEEALKTGDEITQLHIGAGRDRDPAVAELIEAAGRLDVPVRFEKADFFNNIPYKAHQSVIAVGKPFEYVSLDEAIAVRDTGRLIVIMDHLTDPHNVGAILRTAECAGAQAALLPDRRSAGVNATVRKVSAGATSHLAIAKVGNLAQTIRTLKDNGFTVIGAALDEDAANLTDVDFTGDVALVIGAEGEGLSRLVARTCDQLVQIPLKGKTESLNASVAAGILLYEVVRQRDAGV